MDSKCCTTKILKVWEWLLCVAVLMIKTNNTLGPFVSFMWMVPITFLRNAKPPEEETVKGRKRGMEGKERKKVI